MPKLNINKPIEAYKSISQVSKIIDVEAHVLRFWEKEFTQIKPNRSNGRRYYSGKTIEIISKIKNLLHKEGYTLQGAKKYLKEQDEKKTTSLNKTADSNHILQKLREIKTILA
jgi:DNA-binding transcriptional MerR regulator